MKRIILIIFVIGVFVLSWTMAHGEEKVIYKKLILLNGNNNLVFIYDSHTLKTKYEEVNNKEYFLFTDACTNTRVYFSAPYVIVDPEEHWKNKYCGGKISENSLRNFPKWDE